MGPKSIGMLLMIAASVSTYQRHEQTTSTDELLIQLNAGGWRSRADAYERLRSDASALARADVRRGLLTLLDREDRLVESTLRDSHELVGVSGKYGEAFSNYLAQLGERPLLCSTPAASST